MCGIVGVVGADATGSPTPSRPRWRRSRPAAPTAGGAHDGRLGAHPVALGARRLALVDVGGRPAALRPAVGRGPRR